MYTIKCISADLGACSCVRSCMDVIKKVFHLKFFHTVNTIQETFPGCHGKFPLRTKSIIIFASVVTMREAAFTYSLTNSHSLDPRMMLPK